MSYEPTFFVPENIIGYTGVLSKNPTVYFLSSTHYGHITQVHEEWTNVGREVIYSHASYGFGNQRGSLVEMDTGARPMDHTSRSPMTLIGKGTPPPELTHAIMVHSERKARHLTAAGLVINKTDETRARRAHPGQAPDDDERAAAANGTPTLGFWWTRTQLTGVPADSRLYEISRSILNGA